MSLGATPYRRDSWDAMAKTGIGLSPEDKLNSTSRESTSEHFYGSFLPKNRPFLPVGPSCQLGPHQFID
jgi:hypothetical protein